MRCRVYLHMPEGGRSMEGKPEIVVWKGKTYQTVNEPAKAAEPLEGSILGFAVNGCWRGPAFKNILEGTYYAAGSLFTAPNPKAPASLRFNFGPNFKFPLKLEEGFPVPKPFCEAADALGGSAKSRHPADMPAAAPPVTDALPLNV